MSYNKGKNWKKKQVKKILNNSPNYTALNNGYGFFTNPNPKGGIKETKNLNNLAKYCEEVFSEYTDGKVDARFELNPMTFCWEYIVDMYKSRMVMSERKDGDIDVWMYFGNPNKMIADKEATLGFTNIKVLSLTVAAFLDGAIATQEDKKFKLNIA
tara:strand:+ start:46 stop:513 length:468 start_codon:yes stop_codon:yes gene_type:complete